MAALTTLRNIGPAMAEGLQSAGIDSAEELRDIGADAAYARMLGAGQRPHFIVYYVLHMALQGRPWNDCQGAEKANFRKSFDRLCAKHADTGLSELEKMLDQIGVRAVKT